MVQTFDSTIGRANTPRQPTPRPGGIRRWLASSALLLVIAHVIAADPMGRLRADLFIAEMTGPGACHVAMEEE